MISFTYPAAPYRLVTGAIVIWKVDVVILLGSVISGPSGGGAVTPGGITLRRIMRQKKIMVKGILI